MIDKEATDIDIEVRYDESDKTIMVLFRGFENDEDAELYAQYLADNLELLLFETKVIH